MLNFPTGQSQHTFTSCTFSGARIGVVGPVGYVHHGVSFRPKALAEAGHEAFSVVSWIGKNGALIYFFSNY